MHEFTVYAPAKLNLYLDVLDKRPDGYHNIETLFEKIDLRDEILIREAGTGLDIRVEPEGKCPSGKDNIVYKALQLLFKEADPNKRPGLDIVIKKKIPVSGGLGGGSSDAAAILRSVNARFKMGVSKDRLLSVASDTGKDVPFFMVDEAFAVGRGSGELLEGVETDYSFSHVIIKPNISISTAVMYQRLDGYARDSKKAGIDNVVSALKKRDIELLKEAYYNIFENVLCDYNSTIKQAKGLLLERGRGGAFLSGSGPSVFCTVKERREAVQIVRGIPQKSDFEIFVATTCKD